MDKNRIERRYAAAAELRIADRDDEKSILTGYAAVFDQQSEDLGGFVEIISPGAFRNVLSQDIRALANHDSNLILGRTKAGTLRLLEDEVGLRCEIDLPDNSIGQDVKESVRRGDITQMSFAFLLSPLGDEWREADDGQTIRTINLIDALYDVSPVTYAAYPDTSIAVRRYDVFNGLKAKHNSVVMAKNKIRLAQS